MWGVFRPSEATKTGKRSIGVKLQTETLMTQPEIATIRLASQHIAGTKHTSPKEIVTWMVAMQAQDFPMSK